MPNAGDVRAIKTPLGDHALAALSDLFASPTSTDTEARLPDTRTIGDTQ
jgi:hypothetical protein